MTDSFARLLSAPSTRRIFPGVVALLAAAGIVGEDADAKKKKVTICHDLQTIKVSKKSLKSHLAHGDTKGPCRSTNQPKPDPDPVECPAETAYCVLVRTQGVVEFAVVCGPPSGICKCSNPGCTCQTMGSGYLSRGSCSCTPSSCEILSPEGKCGSYQDPACGGFIDCPGTCDVGTCNAQGQCV